MNMPTMSTTSGRPHPPDAAGDGAGAGARSGATAAGGAAAGAGAARCRGRRHRQIVNGHHLSVARVRPSRGHPRVGRTSGMTNIRAESGHATRTCRNGVIGRLDSWSRRSRGGCAGGRWTASPGSSACRSRPRRSVRCGSPRPRPPVAGRGSATRPRPARTRPSRRARSRASTSQPIIGRGWRRAPRRLPHRRRLDARPRRGGPAGDGVRARRGVHRGRAGRADLRRHGAGPRGRRARLGDLPPRRRGLRHVRRRRDATSGCATSSPRSPGCRTTSRRSAATRAGSRCSASRRAR